MVEFHICAAKTIQTSTTFISKESIGSSEPKKYLVVIETEDPTKNEYYTDQNKRALTREDRHCKTRIEPKEETKIQKYKK